jgi:hypothetical protein
MARSFTLGGVEYPLDHLQSFRVTVPQKDPLQAPAVLQVTFSNHVYSVKWDDAVHTADHRIETNNEVRAFCPVRYGCSIGLPAHIAYHVAGKAFEGRDSKGAMNRFFYAEADSIPYPIYFALGAADRIPGVHGVMHIISAYQNPNLRARHRFQSIKFARLVHKCCPPKAAK